ncbi:hypothetical protein [Luteolibacter marinus]|uniref:hypothetical protein n=1 Tax=Luteolibacter marinus TaxID=2776705 RepID=UPI00186672F3|nr:hypothetical protein [Luteolibacter marinus]
MKTYILGIASGILLLPACRTQSGGVPEVTPAMAARTDVSEVRLQNGRDLYMSNCNRCHERVLPGTEDPEFWREVVPHMAKNARLDPSQESDVLVYLMAAHLVARNVKVPD